MGNKTAYKIARAFIDGRKSSLGNYWTDGDRLLLFGNEIATKVNGGFMIRDCGWCSQTTSRALNALPSVRLRILKGEWIWNEEEKWNGQSKFIKYEH